MAEKQEILVANLTLDTYQKNNIPPLVIPQGDYGARVIRVRITEQGRPVTVTTSEAASIVAERTGDGESKAFSGTVNEDGTVNVPVTQWMLDLPDDDVICHVVITGNDYQYSTTEFLIEPKQKANPTEISKDDPRQDIVTEILANESARQAAEATRRANETGRESAENARKEAEENRLQGEELRTANEALRVTAESEREAAEDQRAEAESERAIAEAGRKKEIETLDQRVSKTEKRLTNIEQGVMADSFEVDDSVAYVKDVPSNALPYAAISKVGGMTRKCTNLIPFPYYEASKTENGMTFTVNNDGGIAVSGTPTAYTNFTVSLGVDISNLDSFVLSLQGAYTNLVITGNMLDKDGNKLVENLGYDVPYKKADYPTASKVVVHVKRGNDNVPCTGTAYPMLNAGETALPYEPYFEGLRSASVTEVESVGANLIPYPYYQASKTEDGITFTVNDDGSVAVSGTSTDYAMLSLCTNLEKPLQEGETYRISGNVDGCVVYLRYTDENNVRKFANNTKIVWNKGCVFEELYLQVEPNVTINKTVYPMLNEGSTALPYAPYVKHTLPIPAEVRPAHGINNEVYDYLDLGEQESVVRVGAVDMGTLNWRYDTSNNANVFIAPLKTAKVTGVISDAIISPIYNPCTNEWYALNNYEMVLRRALTANGIFDVVVKDLSYTDAASFKAAMAGVMLYYELAEPIVTDISDILSDDNLIGVEGGGTITMVNEHEYAVPSEIIYQLKGVSV